MFISNFCFVKFYVRSKYALLGLKKGKQNQLKKSSYKLRNAVVEFSQDFLRAQEKFMQFETDLTEDITIF